MAEDDTDRADELSFGLSANWDHALEETSPRGLRVLEAAASRLSEPISSLTSPIPVMAAR